MDCKLPITKGIPQESATEYESGKPLDCQLVIDPNQAFDTCNQKGQDCTSDLKTTQKHLGEWKFYQTSQTSSFASPDFNTCADISKCNINLTFDKEQTDKIKAEYNLELRISSDQAKPSTTEINNESPPLSSQKLQSHQVLAGPLYFWGVRALFL